MNAIDRAVVDVLSELTAMDPSGLPKDAKLATAAGTLTVRTINRAKWALPRLQTTITAGDVVVKPKPRGNYGPLNTQDDDGTWGGDPNGWERE